LWVGIESAVELNRLKGRRDSECKKRNANHLIPNDSRRFHQLRTYVFDEFMRGGCNRSSYPLCIRKSHRTFMLAHEILCHRNCLRSCQSSQKQYWNWAFTSLEC
jgi:hypothetical protein